MFGGRACTASHRRDPRPGRRWTALPHPRHPLDPEPRRARQGRGRRGREALRPPGPIESRPDPPTAVVYPSPSPVQGPGAYTDPADDASLPAYPPVPPQGSTRGRVEVPPSRPGARKAQGLAHSTSKSGRSSPEKRSPEPTNARADVIGTRREAQRRGEGRPRPRPTPKRKNGPGRRSDRARFRLPVEASG
jgi:hypothetical protein